MTVELPRVAVLMATYNGGEFLTEQLRTILSQRGVTVSVFVRDDGSSDNTRDIALQFARLDDRVVVLDDDTPSGGAAQNFARLVQDAPWEGHDYVAFADQDDHWLPGRLERGIEVLRSTGAAGVSSSITAVYPDGRRELVRKDFPQRWLDFVTESPGPGCSFLLTPEMAEFVARCYREIPATHAVEFHDSLIYALARASGRAWVIDSEPNVDYRQHDDNVIGANVGASAARGRLAMMRSGWHRGLALATLDAVHPVATGELAQELSRLRELLVDRGVVARLRLASRANHLRRRPRDRAVLGATIAAGLW